MYFKRRKYQNENMTIGKTEARRLSEGGGGESAELFPSVSDVWSECRLGFEAATAARRFKRRVLEDGRDSPPIKEVAQGLISGRMRRFCA